MLVPVFSFHLGFPAFLPASRDQNRRPVSLLLTSSAELSHPLCLQLKHSVHHGISGNSVGICPPREAGASRPRAWPPLCSPISSMGEAGHRALRSLPSRKGWARKVSWGGAVLFWGSYWVLGTLRVLVRGFCLSDHRGRQSEGPLLLPGGDGAGGKNWLILFPWGLRQNVPCAWVGHRDPRLECDTRVGASSRRHPDCLGCQRRLLLCWFSNL